MVPSEAAARLCSACGMCCDGTLFHSVLLQPEDNSRQLASLGLKIKKRNGRTFFYQPCPTHHQGQCRIYPDRPRRCRQFNCQQLLRLADGKTSEAQALTTIHDARRLADQVGQLMNQIEETNPLRGLAARCASALDAGHRGPLHEQLESAMKSLEAFLESEFRVKF